jgi:DNA helicase-2/ATP-dependent DNA helicase PcrA
MNVSPSVFPMGMELGSDRDIEESRRLLYVALTRAKNNLVLTKNITTTHTSTDNKYFLNKLPNKLTQIHTFE